ncbi:MAG: sulfotransferase [Enterobacterales bacterium]|nr:sulfotransferase [Enterobacterales bacterium]
MNPKNNIIQKQALKAQLAINQGKLTDANKILDKLQTKHKNNELALRVCAALYAKIAAWDQSIKCTRNLLKLDKGKFEYLKALQDLLTKNGQKTNIISDLKLFIKGNPKDARGFMQLALVYHSEKCYKEAIEYFKKTFASKNHLNRVECHFGLALSQIESGNESEGIKNLEACLSLDNQHQQAKFNLATLLQAKGSNEDAAILFDQLIDKHPSLIEALVRRIYLSKITEQSQYLLKLAQARLKLANKFDKEKLNYALGKGYDDLQNYKSAITNYREANQLNRLRIGKYNPDKMKYFVDKTIDTKIISQQMDIDDSISPIFIVGHFRSGSTLIEQIMSRHSNIKALGEVEFFVRLFHQNEDTYWNLLRGNDKAKMLDIKQEYISEISGKNYSCGFFTDKRPENLAFIGVIKHLIPNAKFIITKRNLADNALSIYFQQLNDLSTFSTSFQHIVDYDQQTDRLIKHWKKLYKKDIHIIRYEELISNYEQNARSLIEFVGLPWETDCLDFEKSNNYVRTASVGQVHKKLYSSSIGRIQNYLPYLEPIEKQILLK